MSPVLRWRSGVSLILVAMLMALFESSPASSAPPLASGSASGPAYRQVLQTEFARAATEFQVPFRLLQSIAFVESHWTQRVPVEQDEHSTPPAYGVMGLRDDAWFGRSLEESSRLIGKSPQELMLDSSANIRGAAAFLHELARAENERGARIVLDDQTASSINLLPWIRVLMKYSGIPDESDALLYAQEVLDIAEEGYHKQGIDIEGIPSLTAPLLLDESLSSDASSAKRKRSPKKGPKSGSEYPLAHWEPSVNFDFGPLKPRYIVIHVTEGHYAGSVSWLKNPASKASAHYIIRSRDGSIAQLVSESNIAWHARCWNSLALGIEHEGFDDTGEGFTEELYAASSKLVEHLAMKYGIPLDADHVIGHNFWQTPDFKRQTALNDCNDHKDPGPYWDWAGYFSLIGI